jgi:hypothetical protein
MAMTASKNGGVPVSPWRYDSGADYQGNHVSITINYDNTTRALLGATLHRDAGCVYTKIYIGLGADGKPDSTTHVFNVGNLTGDRSVTPAQLAAVGLSTIEDVNALGQITAGP